MSDVTRRACTVRVARKAVEAVDICTFELVRRRRQAAAGVLGRLAHRRARCPTA